MLERSRIAPIVRQRTAEQRLPLPRRSSRKITNFALMLTDEWGIPNRRQHLHCGM